MDRQLLPPKELAPTLPKGTTSVEAVLIWIDLMRAAERLLMAGFESREGVEGARDAYRSWFCQQSRRHGRHMAHLAKRIRQAGEKR